MSQETAGDSDGAESDTHTRTNEIVMLRGYIVLRLVASFEAALLVFSVLVSNERREERARRRFSRYFTTTRYQLARVGSLSRRVHFTRVKQNAASCGKHGTIFSGGCSFPSSNIQAAKSLGISTKYLD